MTITDNKIREKIALALIDSFKNTKNKNPFKRLTKPDDVAKVVWLLAQDEAAWINGEIIRVDGGEQIVY